MRFNSKFVIFKPREKCTKLFFYEQLWGIWIISEEWIINVKSNMKQIRRPCFKLKKKKKELNWKNLIRTLVQIREEKELTGSIVIYARSKPAGYIARLETAVHSPNLTAIKFLFHWDILWKLFTRRRIFQIKYSPIILLSKVIKPLTAELSKKRACTFHRPALLNVLRGELSLIWKALSPGYGAFSSSSSSIRKLVIFTTRLRSARRSGLYQQVFAPPPNPQLWYLRFSGQWEENSGISGIMSHLNRLQRLRNDFRSGWA